jgi:hypothetical protein
MNKCLHARYAGVKKTFKKIFFFAKKHAAAAPLHVFAKKHTFDIYSLSIFLENYSTKKMRTT